MLDLVFEGGRVVDGTGRPWFRGDVGIAAGRIVRVAPRITDSARVRLGVDRMVVAPGFIDVHAHSDFALFHDPSIVYKMSQGITTEICGNCGVSAAPVRNGNLTRMQTDVCGNLEALPEWETFEQYLQAAGATPLGANAGWMIGYNTVREYVADVRPSLTAEESRRIMDLISDAMRSGALGMSAGLVYEPANYATTDDLVAVCEIVAGWKGIYATHTRGLRETLVDGVNEAIEIGRKSGVPVEVSHLTPQYGGWDLIQPALDAIDKARAAGVDMAFDLHLDSVGGTSALATLPPWIKEGGVEAMVSRFQGRDARAKAVTAIQEFIGPGTSGFLRHARWDLLRVANSPLLPGLVGKSFQEIASTAGTSPWDAYLDAVIANRGTMRLIGLYTLSEDIRRVLAHPLSIVATDADPTMSIPRNWSTIPKLLGRYVREEGVLSLEDAVQKITSRPATRFGLHDRGMLAEGFWADVVVFDPETISPTMTDEGVLAGESYPDPRSPGIRYVAVNGTLAIEDGEPTGALAGTALLKPVLAES